VDARIAANQAQWDERAAIHLESRFYDVDGWLRDQRGPRPREIRALGNIEGLRLVHPQCHFGLDTLAWARAGAEVTGLDFSPVAIAAAGRIAQRAGLAERATFVCTSIDDATSALGGAVFDVVYVSLGALCWLPSVEVWAHMVGALLAPGGRLYLHDVHPLAWALSDDDLRIAHTYFEELDPFIEDSTETYTDATRPREHQRSYEWNHSIGEIVTALIRNGLRITELTEHDWTVWQRWPWLVEAGEAGEAGEDGWTTAPGLPRVPLTFTLLAERSAVGAYDWAEPDVPGTTGCT
jgi:SAM-dependent methyltransferase